MAKELLAGDAATLRKLLTSYGMVAVLHAIRDAAAERADRTNVYGPDACQGYRKLADTITEHVPDDPSRFL